MQSRYSRLARGLSQPHCLTRSLIHSPSPSHSPSLAASLPPSLHYSLTHSLNCSPPRRFFCSSGPPRTPRTSEGASECASEEGEALSDLQVHLKHLRAGPKTVLRAPHTHSHTHSHTESHAESESQSEPEPDLGLSPALLFHLRHPLLQKYALDPGVFAQHATAALNAMLREVDSLEIQDLPDGHARTCPEIAFASEAFSEEAYATLQQLVLGKVGIDDIQSRMQNDLNWFTKVGVHLQHKLRVVEREVTFGYIKDLKVHLSPSPLPTEESIWGARRKESSEVDSQSKDNSSLSEEEETPDSDMEELELTLAGGCTEDKEQHVHAVIDAVFQLRTYASLNYFVEGPPSYNLSVSDEC
jgi:hypothetical protein